MDLEFDIAMNGGLPGMVFVLDEDADLRIRRKRLYLEAQARQVRQRASRTRQRGELQVCMVANPGRWEMEVSQARREPRSATPIAEDIRANLINGRGDMAWPYR